MKLGFLFGGRRRLGNLFEQANSKLDDGISLRYTFETWVAIFWGLILGQLSAHGRGELDSTHFLVNGDEGCISNVLDKVIALLEGIRVRERLTKTAPLMMP